MKKKILISVESQETRAAILEGDTLEEFFVERVGYERLVGRIYKGRVSSVVRGMGAAFIDLGIERNGFLYVSDIIDPEDDAEQAANGGESSKPKKRGPLPKIDQLLKKGQEIVVQIVKEPIGNKGPRLTTQISLPGRFVVLMPYAKHKGVSKRIDDDKERQRLKKMLEEVLKNKDVGCIIRTASSGCSRKDLGRDIKHLLNEWKKIKTRERRQKAPALLHSEYELPLRVVRDYFMGNVGTLLIDSKKEYKAVNHYINSLAPQLKGRIQFYRDPRSLFEYAGIEKRIAQLYERKVDLPCGGHIVIEHTEGMTAIDVNSGKFTGKRNLEETAFRVNKEAAIEISRQIRLRDIGGIVITDFIDMENKGNRRAVYETFEKALVSDKAKTNILSVSEIGVVEMTRQRLRKDVRTVAYNECPYCKGRGMVKSAQTLAIEALRTIERHLIQDAPKRRRHHVELRAQPSVIKEVMKDKRSLAALKRRLRVRVDCVEDASFSHEEIRVTSK